MECATRNRFGKIMKNEPTPRAKARGVGSFGLYKLERFLLMVYERDPGKLL